MNISEIRCDLFTVPQGYYLAHCISGDYSLGAGIAKKFDEIYDMRFKLHRFYPLSEDKKYATVGRALLVDNVFNLVTKQRTFNDVNYEDLYDALIDMQAECEVRHIKKLAIPHLGCGHDKLIWDEVKELIEDVFADMDIEILVCFL